MAQAKTTKKKTEKEADLVAEAAKEGSVDPGLIEVIPEPAAKTGKRSTKAVREEEVKAEKQVRKNSTTKKPVAAPAKKATRSKLERAGKKYREAAKNIDRAKLYSLPEALELAVKTNPAKFDAAVEMHINLGVDPRQADQNVRENVVLPAGTGKTVRIAVLAEVDDAAKAKAAGADITDADKLFAALEKDDIAFDVLIAVPAMMAKLGKYARLLGPRGLMPNPKSGTVTTDIEAAVVEAKAGKIEYRVDQAGIIHLAIGKASFKPEQLQQNADVLISSIKSAKPASLKGIYIKAVHVTTTMGPSIKIDTANI